MANPFEIMVQNLNQLGFFGFLLPFVFIFVVVYGILFKSKVLGDDLRVNAVLSIVIAFFVVGYGGPGIASFFVNIFGVAAAVIAGILVLLLFIGIAGIPLDQLTKNRGVLITLIAIAVVVFFVAAGATVQISQTTIAIVLMIVILAAAISFITGK
jgi:hypothetical protein